MAEKKKKIVSYVESSFDQAASLPVLNIGTEQEYIEQVRPVDGERSFPGQAFRKYEALSLTQHGFLWADTPEASVFVRKKQWSDDGWNYAIQVNPERDNEEAIREKITNGELKNRQIRDVLGKIITRKLEWINDHEQFTKSSAALRTLLSSKDVPVSIQAYYDVGITGKASNLNTKTINEIVNEIGEKVYGKDFKKKYPKKEEEIKTQIISRNDDTLRKISEEQKLEENEFIKQKLDGVFKIPNNTRLYYDDGLDASFFVNFNGAPSTAAEELLLNLYAPTQVSDSAFTRYFKVSTKNKQSETPTERFNGVMEFANITSISTTVNLSGNGTASLTFENPGNIMLISRDDIDLVLAETSVIPDETTVFNDLIYYRGRYYTKTIFDQLAREYSDIYDGVVKKVTQTKTITEEQLYVTKKTDTLKSIAHDWGVTIEEILNTTFKDKKKRDEFLNRQMIVKVRREPYSMQQNFKDQLAAATSFTPINPETNLPTPYQLVGFSKLNSDMLYKEKVLKGIDLIYPGQFLIPVKKQVTVQVEEIQEQPIAPNDEETRDKLRKFAMNRYIIEPMDHVWIWMTSPSKSMFTLTSFQQVVEAPDSVKALDLQADELYTQLEEKNAKIDELYSRLLGEMSPEQREQTTKELNQTQIEANSITAKLNTISAERGSITREKKENKSTDAATANRTELLEDIARDSDLYNVVRETQGLSEQQFQVFEGVILDVQESYSNGKYILTATCNDVLMFLELSRIMETPGLRGTTDPKFELNNPIVTVGEGTEKIGAWKSGMLVRYDELLFTDAEKNTETGKNQEKEENKEEEEIKKEEVARLTASDAQKQIGIFITEKPFAKTDAANVISLLVLGIPYNVDLFLQNAITDGRIQIAEVEKQQQKQKPQNTSKATSKSQSSTKDRSTREAQLELSENGYFQVIKRMIGTQNDYLGNFKPFMPMTATQLKDIRTKREKDLKDMIGKIAILAKTVLMSPPWEKDDQKPKEEDFTIIGGMEKTKLNGPDFSAAVAQLFVGQDIPNKVGRMTLPTLEDWETALKGNSNLKKGLKNPKTVPEPGAQGRRVLEALYSRRTELDSLRQFLSLNLKMDSFLKDTSEGDLEKLGSVLQNRNKRREDIVQNRDDNYLIISDEYAFNQDIAAFNYMISTGNWSLFQSGYETPLNTCKRTAEVVYFEFFADENGNLRFEPPRYNRILKEHLPRLFAQKGVIGDELRAKFKSDNFLKFMDNIKVFESQSALVQENENKLASKKVLEQQLAQYNNQTLSVATNTRDVEIKIKNLENALKVIDISTADSAEKSIAQFLNFGQAKDLDLTNSFIEQGLPVSTSKYFDLKDKKQRSLPYNPEEFKIVANEFGTYINTSLATYKEFDIRQQKALENLLSRQEELQGKVKEVGEIEVSLLQMKENLAELENTIDKQRYSLDDEYSKLSDLTDDAKIHRIPDTIIVTSQYKESKPRFTRLDVSGEPDLVDLTVAHELYYWAGGVDYDLWRTYGFISNEVKLPYLHRGDACKKYCEALLGRQWGQIFTAQITVRGDSKYKLHDSVYVEGRDMYYRISSVSHSFTYGNTYQTTLTLDYGRRPEFIIPDPWDALGSVVLTAAANDEQTNKQTTAEERAKQKKSEEQKTNKTRKKASNNKRSQDDGVNLTSTFLEAEVLNSATAAKMISQPQLSTEAKSNQKEQQRKSTKVELEADIKILKTNLMISKSRLSSSTEQYKTTQQAIVVKNEEIKHASLFKYETVVAERDKLVVESREMEGNIISINKEIEQLNKQIQQKELKKV